MNGSFPENDLQLKASCGSSPPCRLLSQKSPAKRGKADHLGFAEALWEPCKEGSGLFYERTFSKRAPSHFGWCALSGIFCWAERWSAFSKDDSNTRSTCFFSTCYYVLKTIGLSKTIGLLSNDVLPLFKDDLSNDVLLRFKDERLIKDDRLIVWRRATTLYIQRRWTFCEDDRL